MLSENEISSLVSDKLDQTYVITYADIDKIVIYSLATGRIEITVNNNGNLNYRRRE